MFNREKMLAALRWLAANPDKHAEADLAYDAEMNIVSTLDPRGRVLLCSGPLRGRNWCRYPIYGPRHFRRSHRR